MSPCDGASMGQRSFELSCKKSIHVHIKTDEQKPTAASRSGTHHLEHLERALVAELGLLVALGHEEGGREVDHRARVLHHGSGQPVALARLVQPLDLRGRKQEGKQGNKPWNLRYCRRRSCGLRENTGKKTGGSRDIVAIVGCSRPHRIQKECLGPKLSVDTYAFQRPPVGSSGRAAYGP